jgi:hypothetical protein
MAALFANDGDNDDDKWEDNFYLLVYSEASLIRNYDLHSHIAAISDRKLPRVNTCRSNVKYQVHFKIDLY